MADATADLRKSIVALRWPLRLQGLFVKTWRGLDSGQLPDTWAEKKKKFQDRNP